MSYRLPLQTLKITYYELGWLMAVIPENMKNKMEQDVPALKLRMDILASKAYLKGNEQIVGASIKQMKKELLKVTKQPVQQFQPTPAYLQQLRTALKGI